MLKKQSEINDLIKTAAQHLRKAMSLDGDSSSETASLRKYHANMVNAIIAFLENDYGIDRETSFDRCESLNEALVS